MALREETIITKIEVYPTGPIGVYETEKIFKDDTEISSIDNFKLYSPGDSIDIHHKTVLDISKIIWTEDLITKFNKDITQTATIVNE